VVFKASNLNGLSVLPDASSIISREMDVVLYEYHLRTFLWIFFLLFLAFPVQVSSQNLEYKVKAEFLERFTRFIEWPQNSTSIDGPLPFRICVTGKNPFDGYLKQMAGSVKIKGKPVEVYESLELDQIQSCQILFIPSSEERNLQEILRITADKPILTVSDSTGFAQKGVLINFYSTGSYIRFEVNLNAAEKSRLKFSSRLLKLARLV
jgi:YfiR/HmsC-like